MTRKPERQQIEDKLQIETIYRCRIDYDFDVELNSRAEEAREKVAQVSSEYASAKKVLCNAWRGGPAWDHFIIFEGANKNDVKEVAEKTVRYIKRFKGYEIHL